MNWKHYEGSKIQADLSGSGDYVISHRPAISLHVVSYRPPGKHIHVGNYTSAEAARIAAEKHNAERDQSPSVAASSASEFPPKAKE